MKQKEDYFIEVRSLFTDQVAKKTPDQISTEYSYMTLSEHITFVAEIFNKLDINLEGEGMEVAAGASVFSCSVARIFPNVKKIYALEIVDDVVKKLQPKIIEHTNMQGRVIPTTGDFNDTKFQNNSFDFVLGFDSLHHSNNLKKTMNEISRILKPGGRLIFFDRAHPNTMTKAQENFLVNTEYSKAYKIQYGIDPNTQYKRSDQGEHEPRLADWFTSISETKLRFKIVAIFTKRTLRGFLKICASQIPYFIRSYIKKARNLTAYSKLLLYYIFPKLTKYGDVKIFPLNTKFKTSTAPAGKWIFVATKE